ncbi:tyrosine-type recombinase/integrase [Enterovibrio norvegicus]|uniref:tyrosine-type recombinase/integrase n=1 Tax=Enterovibrio norvegicus TaxID=188144 RepID=UPI0024B1706F|nr:site-specific integrase [Enterovibrio norvegicus]
MAKITDAWLRSTVGKPYSGKAELLVGDGLYARISPKGKITWVFRVSFAGKAIKQSLGKYPAMKLSEARDERDKRHELASEGIDPRAALRIQKTASPKTLNDVIDYWIEIHAKHNIQRWKTFAHMFDVDIRPYIGAYPINRLELVDYMACFNHARDRVGPKHSANLMSRLKSVITLGVRHGIVKYNVIHLLKKEDVGKPVSRKKGRQRDEGIGALWNAIDDAPIHPSNRNFLRIMFIFANRANELRLAKKSDFDFKRNLWTVPEENNKIRKKGGGEIVRPIPKMAQEILRIQFSYYPEHEIVFPPVNIDQDRPMSPSVVVAVGVKLADRIASLGYPRTTNHDMRRTARNVWEEMGVKHKVGEIMLGHVVHDGVTSNYLDYHYIPEQRVCYEKWCDYIQQQVLRAENKVVVNI